MIKIRIKTIEELKEVAIGVEETGDIHIDDDVFIINDSCWGESMEYLCGKEVCVNHIEDNGNIKFDGWNLTPNMYTIVGKDWEDIIEDHDVILIDQNEYYSTAIFIDGIFYFHEEDFKPMPTTIMASLFEDNISKIYRSESLSHASALRGDVFDMDLVWQKRDTFEYVEIECYLTGGEVPIYAVTTKEMADKIDMTKNVYVTVMNISECGFDNTEDKGAKYIAGVSEMTAVESTEGYDWKVESVIEL